MWSERLIQILRSDIVPDEEETSSVVQQSTQRIELLTFEINKETYALDIGDVAEILLPKKITWLPRTPDFIMGVITLRGTVLPVISLAKRLGQNSTEKKKLSRIIVVRDGEDRLGFWVDCVKGVVRFSSGDMETSEFASIVDPVFLQGIGYDVSGNLVVVLSSEGLCDFVLNEK